jgi:hypothetical protein
VSHRVTQAEASGRFAGLYRLPAGRGGQADHSAVPGHSPGGSAGRVGFGARHIGRSHSLDHARAVGHAPNIGAIAAEGPAQLSVVGERRGREACSWPGHREVASVWSAGVRRVGRQDAHSAATVRRRTQGHGTVLTPDNGRPIR